MTNSTASLVILFISVIIQISAQAAPAPDFVGTYGFSSTDLVVKQTQHLISVAVRNDEARKFVKKLTTDGYQCVLGANSISKCKKFDREISEDAGLRADLIREMQPMVLNFELSNEDYELVNDAPSITELEKNQNSSFEKQLFNKIRVYILKDGPTKFKIFSSQHEEQNYFYLNEESLISQQVRAVRVNQKQNVNIIDDRVVYLYEAVWKK